MLEYAIIKKLANYNRGLSWQYGVSNDDKQKTQKCMDKFDGYLNGIFVFLLLMVMACKILDKH